MKIASRSYILNKTVNILIFKKLNWNTTPGKDMNISLLCVILSFVIHGRSEKGHGTEKFSN
jgi:hypothetical protein